MLKIRKLTVGGVTYELAGEKGDPGEQGLQGEKGDKGDKGEPGAGLETVLPLIPEEASSENQLADKAYVNCVAAGISIPGTVTADGSAVIPEGKNDPTGMTLYYPDSRYGVLVSQYHRMNALCFNNSYNLYPGSPEYSNGVTLNYQKDGHCRVEGIRTTGASIPLYNSTGNNAPPIFVKANTPVYVRDLQIIYVPASEMPETLTNVTGGTVIYGLSAADYETSAPVVFTPTQDICIVKASLYIKANTSYNHTYFPQIAIGYSASEVQEEVYPDNWYYTLPAVEYETASDHDPIEQKPTVTIGYQENRVSASKKEFDGDNGVYYSTEGDISALGDYSVALIHRPQSGQTVSVCARSDDFPWGGGTAVPFDIRYEEAVTAVSFYQNRRKLLGIWTGETSFGTGIRSFLNMEGFRRFEIVFQYTDQASGATGKPYYLRETVEIGRPICVQCLIDYNKIGSRRITGIFEDKISFSFGYASGNDPSVLVPIEIWGIA